MSESEMAHHNALDTQQWIKRWDEGSIGFHKHYINPLLEKHVSKMVDGRTNLKIFVPLCGKSWDMKWLADQGHTVIGVEAAQKAIEEFFEENKISFTTESLPAIDGTLFQSEDKKVQMYCCDLFNLSEDIVGQVDAIWDRASMVAINVSDRPRYAALMQSLMTPSCRYFLSALHYDPAKYKGPPHHLSDEAIQEVYGSGNAITEVDSCDSLEEHQKAWGIDWMTEKLVLITPK